MLLHHVLNKKLSYRQVPARRTMSVEILSTAVQLYQEITFKMVCHRRMTLKFIHCHRKWGPVSLLVCDV